MEAFHLKNTLPCFCGQSCTTHTHHKKRDLCCKGGCKTAPRCRPRCKMWFRRQCLHSFCLVSLFRGNLQRCTHFQRIISSQALFICMWMRFVNANNFAFSVVLSVSLPFLCHQQLQLTVCNVSYALRHCFSQFFVARCALFASVSSSLSPFWFVKSLCSCISVFLSICYICSCH